MNIIKDYKFAADELAHLINGAIELAFEYSDIPEKTEADSVSFAIRQVFESLENGDMEREEFDRMQAIGRKLREIFDRDKTPFAPGCEDYLVRSVEEATRLTPLAPDSLKAAVLSLPESVKVETPCLP